MCYSLVILAIQWLIISRFRGTMISNDQWFERSVNLQFYVPFTISLPAWLKVEPKENWESRSTSYLSPHNKGF